jgi:hypothetical protein
MILAIAKVCDKKWPNAKFNYEESSDDFKTRIVNK